MVTTLMKKNKNCIKSMLTDADNFGVEFTPKMDWKDRSLLLATVMFIDYMIFEEKGGAGANAGGGGDGF